MGNIARNARAFKAYNQTRLCAVVKADAYGHGAEEVVRALSGVADCFAVALVEEGVAIRTAACGKDILVFTPPTDEESAYALAVNGFIASVSDLYTAKLFARVCEKYRLAGRVHLKVNTGMNRYGMNASALGKVCCFLKERPYIVVEGIYSHLFECKIERALWQRERFLQMEKICRRYYPAVVAHLSATYGGTIGKGFSMDMVRVGLGLYGYTPTPSPFKLYRGMEIFATVAANRKYAYGGAGYGEIPPPERGKTLSVLRVGYADGFLRRKENGLGRAGENANALCMDVCLQWNTRRRGKTVSIMSDADETAKAAGTVAYEVLCAATRRAERIYIE